ncbi:glycoside hydrolase family 31 protein [Paenibacillus segetis]|uniref:Glycoside hydrolase n=1 Tax=Paenibacillus segetis TaxID=1325360 RepID=A0ABQ1YS65_9BACL|nr:glycoside hydrolase family 31 protein [Paenibacillus segetis]GGH36827.1 glycoside hydrolase [Paenibacillus segetis]
MNITFDLLTNERWYGGYCHYGWAQPLGEESESDINMEINTTVNQAMPFMVSTKGRYIWCEDGFQLHFKKGTLSIDYHKSEPIISAQHATLQEAYIDARAKHFPFKGDSIGMNLFTAPQYNTWIELTFYQNQKDVMKYAADITGHGLPSGVLMIDDGWSDYYGKWSFNKEKFPDAKQMIDDLHTQGFKVMAWICPFITPDTTEFRYLRDHHLLIETKDNDPYICKWWNGYSAVLDMSNPATIEWLDQQLSILMNEYGVDGFKFDAGDSIFYSNEMVTYSPTDPNTQSRLWAEYGSKYEYNEFRVTWKAAGLPLMQRLADKNHSWDEHGIQSLIPNTLVQGITGHPFVCTDMIGGGEYLNFHQNSQNLDEELFVRHAQIACLLPTMQFSAAPWRVLSPDNFELIKKSVELRNEYMPLILQLVDHARLTGEPIARLMDYVFPNQNLENITDQFMLGDQVLVAPILLKGAVDRFVKLPKGTWKDRHGLLWDGGVTVTLAPLVGEPIVLELQA